MSTIGEVRRTFGIILQNSLPISVSESSGLLVSLQVTNELVFESDPFAV